MKSKLPCDVVTDLLPSYVDGLTNETTSSYIKEHLSECSECNNKYKSMMGMDITPETSDEEEKEIDFLKKQKKNNAVKTVLLFATLVLCFLVVAVIIKSRPKTPDFKEIAPELTRGDTFTFGSYEQDANESNGSEPIEWIVLTNWEGLGVIEAMSYYGLDTKQYHSERSAITWEESDIRAWLNTEFYDSAFSEKEKYMIQEKEILTPANEYYKTDNGNNTLDKVTLISSAELNAIYVNNGDGFMLKCYPTAYALKNGAFVDPKYNECDWWGRGAGIHEGIASSAKSSTIGIPVTTKGFTVRPIIYIKYK